MFRHTAVLVLFLVAPALCKVRTSKRPGFMMGNPLYDPVWEDDTKIVGGNEVQFSCLVNKFVIEIIISIYKVCN